MDNESFPIDILIITTLFSHCSILPGFGIIMIELDMHCAVLPLLFQRY